MRHLVINLLLLLGLLGGQNKLLSPLQQNGIEFRNATVENNFPDGLTFRVEICGRSESSTVTFHYMVANDDYDYLSWQNETRISDEGQTSDRCDKRMFRLQPKEFEIPPFAPIRYYWSVDQNHALSLSPRVVYYYRDGRYDWKTLEKENLVVWWHDRPEAFAQEVVSIATRAEDDQSEFYALSLNSPITIVITNTPDEFFAWQDEETYAGGMAIPELNLTILDVVDDVDYHDWLLDVVPHEISHVYFFHLARRRWTVPNWFDEGLATYQEYSDHSSEWMTLRDAIQLDQLLSLQDLEGDFGKDEDKVALAYAESYYAIVHMNEVYGQEAVAVLLSELGRGMEYEYAFQKAFGKTNKEFETDYVAWLKTRIKTAPPNTEVQRPLSAAETNRLFVVLLFLCSLPIWFIAFGAGLIVILWKLNNRSAINKV